MRVCVCVCVCVRVCVCGAGMRMLFLGCKGVCSFLVKQMWTSYYAQFTAGNWERVLTTYMVVVLFLERPALLSAPRPQTSPSSCAALQLRKGNLNSREQAQVTYDAKSRQYRICVLCNSLSTNSPNHKCSSGTITFTSASMLL